MKFSEFLIIIIISLFFSGQAIAHPGRTANDGCHKDRIMNEQHCHRESRALVETIRYDRNDWPHWIDSDGDCQNLRQELLILSSKTDVSFTRSDNCTVATGRWVGAYSEKSFSNASEIDLDHLVPLAYAHKHGGASWTRSEKQLFANDIENLFLIDDGINQSKSSRGIDEWLPQNEKTRCGYIKQFLYVLEKYSLTMPDAKKVQQLLSQCERL